MQGLVLASRREFKRLLVGHESCLEVIHELMLGAEVELGDSQRAQKTGAVYGDGAACFRTLIKLVESALQNCNGFQGLMPGISVALQARKDGTDVELGGGNMREGCALPYVSFQ